MNEFEQRLHDQRPRQIPASWRNEILAKARAAEPEPSSIRHPASGIQYLASFISRLSSALLWPHPKAWAGLAAVWLVIGWLNW